MKLYYDLDVNRLVTAPGNTTAPAALVAKRADAITLDIQFCRGVTIVQHASGVLIRFGLKPVNRFDGDFLVYEDTFTWVGGSDQLYRGTPSFNTTEIDEGLLVDDSETNDAPSIAASGEITFAQAATPTQWTSCETFAFTIVNDVIRGDEGAPEAATPASWAWLKARIVAGDNVTLDVDDEAQTITVNAAAGGAALSTDGNYLEFTISGTTYQVPAVPTA